MTFTLTLIDERGMHAERDVHALDEARLALEAAEARATPYEMCAALSRLAQCYGQGGAAGVAEALYGQAVAWARATGSTDMLVQLLCDACELMAAHASPQRETAAGLHQAAVKARTLAAEAAALSCHVADPAWESRVLLRLSDVLDRLGEHGGALDLQLRALAQMSGASRTAEASPVALALPLHATLQ